MENLDTAKKNIQYAPILADWTFNTKSRFCPPELENQYKAFLRELNARFIRHGKTLYISKNYSDSLVFTSVDFKQLFKMFPMLLDESVLRFDVFKLITFVDHGDLKELIMM